MANLIEFKFSLDSFKIRLPYNQVEILDKVLELSYLKWDIERNQPYSAEEFKSNSYAFESYDKLTGKKSGIKYKYAIEYQQTNNGLKKYVIILINSKWLKEKYFAGITLDSIGGIYEAVLDHKVIHLSYDTFLNGELTDLDIKSDFISDLVDYSNIIEYAKLRTKSSSIANRGYKLCGTKSTANKNFGIEWGGSRSKATVGSPYIKIYSKSVELFNKSQDFANYHLSEFDKDIRRIEYTLKNKYHITTSLRCEDSKLKTILSLSNEVLKNACGDNLNKHFSQIVQVKLKSDLVGLDLALYRLIEQLILVCKMPFNEIENLILSDYETSTKVQKSRIKRKLKFLKSMLYESLDIQVQDMQNQAGYSFFKSLI